MVSVITVGIRVNHADGGHVHFTLFIGPDGARGNAGDLVLRVVEFWWLVDRLPGVVLTGEQVVRP